MGRRAGVAAGETRAALLQAAARVFARRGYDGAGVSDIASEAGLTSGAIYAHYASKAELFSATLVAFAERDLDAVLGGDGSALADGLVAIGATFDRREPTEASLLVSAMVAAHNDPEVAKLLAEMLGDRERLFRTVIEEGQAAGQLSAEASAPAVARLALMIAMGSLVVGALGLDEVGHDEWKHLVEKLVGVLRT